MEAMNLYQRLKDAGCELDSWQSDLYVKSTPEALAIIAEFEAQGGISNKKPFISDVDGKRWIDLPFAFQPWWDARAEKGPGESAEEASAPKL